LISLMTGGTEAIVAGEVVDVAVVPIRCPLITVMDLYVVPWG
jgi:hypothetical protein